MKIFLAVLGLILLATGVYFWLGADGAKTVSDNASSTYAEFLKKLAALNNIKQKGLDILNNVGGFISSTERKITGVKDFLEAAPKTVSSTISGLYNQVKGQISPAILTLLAGSSTQSLQNFISPSGQFSLATSSGSFQKDICVEFNNNESVGYSVQNPFSPAKDYTYYIDWGDGTFSDGNVKSGDAPLATTHHYGASGSYQNLFSIKSASTTLTAQVRICIN